jgi:hypothetical protein
MQLAVLCWGGFHLFLRSVLRQVSVSSTRWFGDDGLQACVAWGVAPVDFFQRLLDLVVRSGWFLRSSKPCVAMTFAGATFPCCLSSAFFKLRWTTNFGRKMTRVCSSM